MQKDVVIYKQAAIDAVEKHACNTQRILDAISALPSAHPEIIRCYECKYGTHSGCGDIYICNVSHELVSEHKADFYCGYAERRTDEQVN